jgi:DNA-binding NtrC family response regulator
MVKRIPPIPPVAMPRVRIPGPSAGRGPVRPASNPAGGFAMTPPAFAGLACMTSSPTNPGWFAQARTLLGHSNYRHRLRGIQEIASHIGSADGVGDTTLDPVIARGCGVMLRNLFIDSKTVAGRAIATYELLVPALEVEEATLGMRTLVELHQLKKTNPGIKTVAHQTMKTLGDHFPTLAPQIPASEEVEDPWFFTDPPKPTDRERRAQRKKAGAQPLHVVKAPTPQTTKTTVRHFGKMISVSPLLHDIFDQLERVATTNARVLLLGETGTGKELMARAIHEASARRDGPFVAINCGAIPQDLIEAELFGAEQGAFTGATRRREGRFHQAHGGTLLLDELGEMSLLHQTRLLRVIEDGSFYRVGGVTPQHVDVRIISSTNRSLKERTDAGLFRSDLYYRLAVITPVLPPLRDRPEDILALTEHFLDRKYLPLNDPVIAKLLTHSWPGNVRELQNMLERAEILSEGTILPHHLELHGGLVPTSVEDMPRPDEVAQALREIEDLAGRATEIPPKTLQRRLATTRRVLAHLMRILQNFDKGRIDGPKGKR